MEIQSHEGNCINNNIYFQVLNTIKRIVIMFYFIIDIKNRKIIYTTNHFNSSLYLNPILSNINNLDEYRKNNQQIRNKFEYYIDNDKIFGLFALPQEEILGDEENSKMTHQLLRKTSSLIKEINLSSEVEPIYPQITESLLNNFFPHNKDIFLIGSQDSGTSTIMFKWLGLTILRITDRFEKIVHVPYDKKFNEYFIRFRIMSGEFLYSRHRRIFDMFPDSYFIFITKSNDRNEIEKFKFLLPKDNNHRVIFLANKQDLPNAIPPEKIEEKLGLPTYGLTAIAPDAVIQLEKIISKLLNN